MELLINDLSINGQFPDIPAFKEAIERIMRMRNIARQFGRQLHCHRNVAHSQVTQILSMQQVVGSLNREQQRDVMQWLTKNGPFWKMPAPIGLMITWNVMVKSLQILRSERQLIAAFMVLVGILLALLHPHGNLPRYPLFGRSMTMVIET